MWMGGDGWDSLAYVSALRGCNRPRVDGEVEAEWMGSGWGSCVDGEAEPAAGLQEEMVDLEEAWLEHNQQQSIMVPPPTLPTQREPLTDHTHAHTHTRPPFDSGVRSRREREKKRARGWKRRAASSMCPYPLVPPSPPCDSPRAILRRCSWPLMGAPRPGGRAPAPGGPT